MHPTPNWYAVYTCSRAEKKIAREFDRIGVVHYLPLMSTMRQWSDRKKMVEIPLISSYIFVQASTKEHLPVLQVPGVVKIVNFCGEPAPIPEWQIQNLRILLGSSLPLSRNGKLFSRGKNVKITRGSLTGLQGIITLIKGRQKLLISINALDFNLTVDIDPVFVEMD